MNLNYRKSISIPWFIFSMSNLKQQERMPLIALPQHSRTSVWKSLMYVGTFIKDQYNLTVKQITCRPVAKDSEKNAHQEERVGREIISDRYGLSK